MQNASDLQRFPDSSIERAAASTAGRRLVAGAVVDTGQYEKQDGSSYSRPGPPSGGRFRPHLALREAGLASHHALHGSAPPPPPPRGPTRRSGPPPAVHSRPLPADEAAGGAKGDDDLSAFDDLDPISTVSPLPEPEPEPEPQVGQAAPEPEPDLPVEVELNWDDVESDTRSSRSHAHREELDEADEPTNVRPMPLPPQPTPRTVPVPTPLQEYERYASEDADQRFTLPATETATQRLSVLAASAKRWFADLGTRARTALSALVTVAIGIAAGVALWPSDDPAVIQLSTAPGDAEVRLDGSLVSSTSPHILSGLTPEAQHVIAVHKEGYHPWETSLTLRPGQVMALPEVELRRVEAETEATAAAPEEERERPRAQRRRGGARQAASRKANRAGQAQGAKKATLRINSRPWAQVHIDGRYVGTTPQTGLSLSPGRHRVLLVNTDFGLRKQLTVRLRPGQVVTRVINLAER